MNVHLSQREKKSFGYLVFALVFSTRVSTACSSMKTKRMSFRQKTHLEDGNKEGYGLRSMVRGGGLMNGMVRS